MSQDLAFFTDYGAFDQQRMAQHASGVNDYSLLNALLKLNDEVRLHSRFLYSLLNPRGTHYQGSLFAEYFMSSLADGRYRDWLAWDRLKVYRERNSIDLYLTDGTRHVVIENKLNAGDQEQQINRYIRFIQETHEADPEDILLVYLSKGRKKPSEQSLGEFTIDAADAHNMYVVDDAQVKQAHYLSCHYSTEINRWLDACQAGIAHHGSAGKNLAFALAEYRLILQRLNQKSERNSMSLAHFLVQPEPQHASQARIDYAFEIAEQLPALKADWLINAFDQGMRHVLQGHEDHMVEIRPDDSHGLSGYQFKADHARAFFGVKSMRDYKSKGKFWLLTQDTGRAEIRGTDKSTLALVMFFGSEMLHIGLLPVTIKAGTQLAEPSNDHSLIVLTDLNQACTGFSLKNHDRVNRILPGLVSWAEPLNEAIRQMWNFEESRQAQLIGRLLKYLKVLNLEPAP